jgi:N-terminal domain of (some) glycogen debranching enzymes
MRADFAEIFEVKDDNIVRRGHIVTSWSAKRKTLQLIYRNRDFCREVIFRTGKGDGSPTVYANGRLSFDIALKPRRAWHRCLIYDLADGSKRFRTSRECISFNITSDHSRNMDEWSV